MVVCIFMNYLLLALLFLGIILLSRFLLLQLPTQVIQTLLLSYGFRVEVNLNLNFYSQPSIESTKTIEEIADVGFANQTMFHQEYVWSNRTLLIDDLSRIEAAGYKAIFLTVDNTGVNGIRCGTSVILVCYLLIVVAQIESKPCGKLENLIPSW